jgi:hypothetical protein
VELHLRHPLEEREVKYAIRLPANAPVEFRLGEGRVGAPTRQAPANADDQPWGDDDRDAAGENRARRWAPSRNRDKIAASKKKGMWMGGLVPIGYDVIDRRLVVNQLEAETVREIFRRYLELGSVRLLMEDLNSRGIRSKVRIAKNGKQSGGKPFLPGCALRDAFEPHLPRRDPAQGGASSGSA